MERVIRISKMNDEQKANVIHMYRCTYCYCSFALSQHLSLHHMFEHVVISYRCTYCAQLFANDQMLVQHFNSSHQINSAVDVTQV